MSVSFLNGRSPVLRDVLPTLILASQSPARRQLLEEAGVHVIVRPTWANEEHTLTEARDVVSLLARRKLEAAIEQNGVLTHPLLACDTIIAIDGDLMGKPTSIEEARLQLNRLRASVQQVWSAWALYKDGSIIGGADVAHVNFRDFSDQELESYLSTGEWMGAAGSYRIQGQGKRLVASIDGDVNVVIGLALLQMERALTA